MKAAKIVAGVAATGASCYMFRDKVRAWPAYGALLSSPPLSSLLLAFPPETAHNIAVALLKFGLGPLVPEPDGRKVPGRDGVDEPVMTTGRIAWLQARNPIGLAAGFDKHGEAMEGALDAGFGFVEVGSVTPLPQAGNAKPRLFRLTADKAVINRYGFNSEGATAVAERFAEYRRKAGFTDRIVGINVGKNKDGDAKSDYVAGVRVFAPFADYLVINVSSPNTPGLRNLQARDQLRDLLNAVKVARDELAWGRSEKAVVPTLINSASAPQWQACLRQRAQAPPLFVKIAPDLTDDELLDIVTVVNEVALDGLIVSNTTVTRPSSLKDSQAGEVGGLSGKPLAALATSTIHRTYALTQGAIPIIGVGGISSADDALEKIEAGANVCQLYSALVYEGLALIPTIRADLQKLLKKRGYRDVSAAVGAAHRKETR